MKFIRLRPHGSTRMGTSPETWRCGLSDLMSRESCNAALPSTSKVRRMLAHNSTSSINPHILQTSTTFSSILHSTGSHSDGLTRLSLAIAKL